MGVITYTMKNHVRKIITHLFPNISHCSIHGCRPIVFEIIAGRKRETYYVVVCKISDQCNKISLESADKVVEVWEKHNKRH